MGEGSNLLPSLLKELTITFGHCPTRQKRFRPQGTVWGRRDRPFDGNIFEGKRVKAQERPVEEVRERAENEFVRLLSNAYLEGQLVTLYEMKDRLSNLERTVSAQLEPGKSLPDNSTDGALNEYHERQGADVLPFRRASC